MNKTNSIIRTKMSEALIKGLHSCVAEGRNPGKVGRTILTLEAKGAGVKFAPRTKKQEKIAA